MTAVNLRNKFALSVRKIACVLNVSKSSVHKWIKTGFNSMYARKPKYNILSISKFISSYIDSNPFITISEIKTNLQNKHNIHISRTLIHSIIHKHIKLTYKKVSNKQFRSLSDIKLKTDTFVNKIKKIQHKNIICIDETYVYLNSKPNYGWSAVGKRLIHYNKVNPIKYSLLVATSVNGICKYIITKNNVTSEIFNSFMISLFRSYKQHTFIMDNASIHRSKRLNEINGSSRIIYIPPYSPQFNPIEHMFSSFKNSINRNNISSIKSIQTCLLKYKKFNMKHIYNKSFKAYKYYSI